MLPAFPCPYVLVLSSAPLVRDRDLVVTLILPPLPTAPESTSLYTPLGYLQMYLYHQGKLVQ